MPAKSQLHAGNNADALSPKRNESRVKAIICGNAYMHALQRKPIADPILYPQPPAAATKPLPAAVCLHIATARPFLWLWHTSAAGHFKSRKKDWPAHANGRLPASY